MKSAPLGLAGGRGWSLTTEPLPVDGDRMTALIHSERQRCKKNQLLRDKKITSSVFVSTTTTCSKFQMLCMPSFIDFHTRMHTQHQAQAMWRRLLAVETLPIDRWHDCTTRRSTRSIATELKHETLPANRARLLEFSWKLTWKLTAPCKM